MEKKLDYESLKKKMDEYNKLVTLYSNLNSLGIPLRKVHFYETPCVSSGYSMGERLHVKCNDMDVEDVDQTHEYSKSCKWRAKHGIVVVRFTKKSLKKYIDLCYSHQRARECGNVKDILSTREEIKNIVKDAIDDSNSIIKNLSVL